jgi:hypothetical protein
VTKYQISAINSCWEKCDDKCACMFNVNKNQLSRQTGSRNLTGPKTLPTIWYTYMVYHIVGSVFEPIRFLLIPTSCLSTLLIFIHIEHICLFFVAFFSVTVDGRIFWWVQKPFPWYGVPIWSLWPNIRFLPSIVAEKNVMTNVHICSMWIKTN